MALYLHAAHLRPLDILNSQAEVFWSVWGCFVQVYWVGSADLPVG